jgi:hypothetical protein
MQQCIFGRFASIDAAVAEAAHRLLREISQEQREATPVACRTG